MYTRTFTHAHTYNYSCVSCVCAHTLQIHRYTAVLLISHISPGCFLIFPLAGWVSSFSKPDTGCL